jgi:RHS repeat-associated protein
MTSTINRYYDPSTDQFLSIDPDVATTDQPYVFTNDDPLNAEDPMGLCIASRTGCETAQAYDRAQK